MNREIEEMAKQKKCAKCIHNAVCEKLEELRDPLGWVDVNGEFYCSYYEKSTDVVREFFAEIERIMEIDYNPDTISDYPSPYYDKRLKEDIAELRKEYESEGEE